MKEKQFVQALKQEFFIKEFIWNKLGRIASIRLVRTPIGEKIVVSTDRPGLIMGRGGENIQNLVKELKERFKLENPHIEVTEVENPLLEPRLVAYRIATQLERFGHLAFKAIAYRTLQRIKEAGALGVEIVLSGKLPSEKARTWRFAWGHLKKAGETTKLVKQAKYAANLKVGTIGIKVSILPPDAEVEQIRFKQPMQSESETQKVESENEDKSEQK